jgi:transposase
MPAAYSNDLREKVMAALDRGEKKSHVSQMFNISRDSIDRWLKRREVTGNVKAAQGYQKGHSHRIEDWDQFRAFAQKYGDKTQAEMTQLWPGAISKRTIARALAHIDWTRKKRLMATENETKPNVMLS